MNKANLLNISRIFQYIRFQRTYISSNPMAYVAVRRIEGEGRIQMTLSMNLNDKPNRTFNFDRSCDESVGATLQRISANVQKHFMKKKKGKAKDASDLIPSEVCVELWSGGEKIDGKALNADAWHEGAKLNIAGKEFVVYVNVPTIKSLEFPTSLMSGFAIFPKIETEFIDKWATEFVWYKDDPSNIPMESSQGASACVQQGGQNANKIWTKVSEGLHYTPTNTDIGCHLRVVATPRVAEKCGEPVEIVSKETVNAGPGFCPFENRLLYTKKVAAEDSVRIVSYNILADTYADSDYSREHLYPYCPPYALAIDYRRQLLIKEILGYNADVVCLQEVDRKVFNHELKPVMESMGLEGVQLEKAGETPEGSAVFYRTDKFKCIGEHNIIVSNELMTHADNSLLWEKIQACEPLAERVGSRTTCLQVLVLESKHLPGKVLCVATTHLYFHPNANHLRLIQGAVCMNHIKNVMEIYQNKGFDPALLLCGDLNSMPTNGLIQFLNDKVIKAKDPKWHPSDSPPEEDCGGLDLEHNFDLESACGYPDFTNYTGGFHGCLDYIFIDKTKFNVTQVIPLPSLEEVTQHIALPNVVFPSDHLALVCDTQWKS